MLRYLTAGESHGPALTVVVDGLPAAVPVDLDAMAFDLKRRQGGYGRGGRMKIESDSVEVLSGVRHGRTLGSPVTLQIRNKDFENWRDVMSPAPQPPAATRRRALKHPRPGHADLAGAMKFLTDDLRNVLERASARETTARVAAGALAKAVLRASGAEVRSHVLRIGDAALGSEPVSWETLDDVESSSVRCVDGAVSGAMVAAIDQAKRHGDSLGGVFEVIARGLPPGLGSFSQWDRRLDGRIAQALMSIHAVKAVSLGAGFEAGATPGARFHDEILYDDSHGGLHRGSNRAGGLEGGVTNGEELRAQAVVKPIPTLLMGLRSIDMRTKEPRTASVERSDTCVVPAAGVVGEAMLSLVLADSLLEKFGGDSLDEYLDHLEATRTRTREFLARRPPAEE